MLQQLLELRGSSLAMLRTARFLGSNRQGYTGLVTEPERDQLRERVAAGLATGEERDRLASLLARAIRDRADVELDSIEALIGELRTLASAGSDRTSCTDALAGALLDAQIRAFERGDAADAWRRLDEIRARLHHGGTPDLLHDRLAAALYNMVRGGELLGDTAMRLAALQELRTRAYGDPSAAACRVALAELLADGIARAVRHDDGPRAISQCTELQRLRELDPSGVAVSREYARGLCELLAADPSSQLLDRLRALAAEFELASGDAIRIFLAEAIVTVHAHALREQDESGAAALREELRTLARMLAEQGRSHTRARTAVTRELGMALHDAAVTDDDVVTVLARSRDALAELRTLVEQYDTDIELRGQLMSVLYRAHHGALERDDDEAAEHLQIEADALLARDDALSPDDEADAAMRSGLLGRQARRRARRTARLRAELRLDHLRMLLATHARAGDCGDWSRAELLLVQARALVERDPTALEMIELLGQMLVNAHVDAGVPHGPSSGAAPDEAELVNEQQRRARALLSELRELADARPQSAALQLHRATALFNAHVDAGRRHALHEADRLLGELEQLHTQHADLLELRRRFAMALVNHHGGLLEREDFARAAPLLERMRTLVRSPDADDQLRVQLAMAVGNSLAHIEDPVSDIQGQRMISELRVLAGHPDASDTLRALVLDELSELFAPRQ
jgi:hypothetical protein